MIQFIGGAKQRMLKIKTLPTHQLDAKARVFKYLNISMHGGLWALLASNKIIIQYLMACPSVPPSCRCLDRGGGTPDENPVWEAKLSLNYIS